jgi:putative spermidine/putrescine transport system permease protein
MRSTAWPSTLTLATGVVGLSAVAFLLAPLVVVLPNGFSSGAYLQFPTPGISLRWFRNFAANRTWTDALLTSLQVGLGAGLLATITGTAAALALHDRAFRGKAAVGVLLLAPLILPSVIVGITAYAFFVEIRLYGSLVALIATHAVLGMPYVLLSTLAALSRQDPRLDMAARSLGASPRAAFREVTLPLAIPGILSGAVLAFVVSFDDIVVASFLAGVRTTTLPMRMFQAVEAELDPTIAAASTLLIAFSALVLLALWTIRAIEERRRTLPPLP